MRKRFILPHWGMFFGILAALGLCASACSYPTERFHPKFQGYHQSMGVMLVLVPEIGIFEQSPDGGRLFKNIPSQEAQRTTQETIVSQLRQRHFAVKRADARLMRLPEIQSLTRLFRSVNRSIQLHTFGPQLFPSKLQAFDYQVGPVADLLKANGADGLILSLGYQTGHGQPSRNWLSIAVVEPQGRIIWYGVKGDHHRFDLQSPDSVAELVAHTMTHFWESGA